jgi:fructose-1,6-bisphosphatase/inositol monophosphatase family enzyme
MRRKRKTIECIEYLSVEAPLEKVDYLEDKQSKYIREYVRNKEYLVVGTERRHGFSRRDVDRQWMQIVNKVRKKQVDGVIVANMRAVTDSMVDAFIKVAQIQEAGGIVVTVDDGRLEMNIRGFSE